MRLLWRLPKAAPALLRHLVAYVELAGLDFATAKRDAAAQLLASLIVVVCVIFALFLACLGVVAYTWDTPHRVSAIAWMGGGFLLAAIVAALYRARIARAAPPLFASVRQEWEDDRVILERILSEQD